MKKKLIILFSISILLVILISIILIRYYLPKSDRNIINQNNLEESIISVKPSFGIYPQKESFAIGKTTDIRINLDTAGKNISGADAVILYNPEYVEVLEIIPGKVFPNYPLFKNNWEKGEISITGTIYSPDEKSFLGKGNFAIIKIKFLKKGETKIEFDFYPEKTSDTNLTELESGKDVLEMVNNAIYTIN